MQPIPSFVTVKGPEADEARKLPAPVRRNTPNPVAQALLNGDMIWLPVDTRRAQQLSQTVKKRGMRVHVRRRNGGGASGTYLWADKSSESARSAPAMTGAKA